MVLFTGREAGVPQAWGGVPGVSGGMCTLLLPPGLRGCLGHRATLATALVYHRRPGVSLGPGTKASGSGSSPRRGAGWAEGDGTSVPGPGCGAEASCQWGHVTRGRTGVEPLGHLFPLAAPKATGPWPQWAPSQKAWGPLPGARRSRCCPIHMWGLCVMVTGQWVLAPALCPHARPHTDTPTHGRSRAARCCSCISAPGLWPARGTAGLCL